MAKALMFGLALACAAAMPARADWQFTKWGMTAAQVQKASHGVAVPVEPGDSAESASSFRKGTPELMMPYASGSFVFKTYFLFDGDHRLSAVDLTMKSSDSRAIIDALTSKYGKPVRFDPGETVAVVVWQSAADEIRLVKIVDSISVAYSPRTGGDSSGL